MSFQRVMAGSLVALLACSVPVVAQQPTPPGVVAGRVSGEAKKPYTNYAVQLRDTETGQIVRTLPVDVEGRFSVEGLDASRTLLVELYNLTDKSIVCTEGPFPFDARRSSWLNVVVDCGMAPAAWWIMTAAAGTVSAVGLLTVSASK